MSELAFNLNGEPFEVPPAATGWRVRKFKSKGAPEVVYGREGTPLVLGLDAGMEDLRREARAEGRYRLDAVDDGNRMIVGAQPAYVCVQAGEPAVAPPIAAALPDTLKMHNVSPPTPDAAVIEAMRVNSAGFLEAMKVNAELARTVIERFPTMLDSASVLIRAADAAGMPARPPRPYEVVEIDDEDMDDEREEPAPPAAPPPPAKPSGFGGLLERLLEAVAPEVMRAVLSGKLQVPGGLRAVLDPRRSSADVEVDVAAVSARVVEPAPGRGVPAPAASSRVRASAGSAPAGPRSAAPVSDSSDDETPSTSTARAASTGSSAGAAVASVPADLPTLDAADMAHFAQILGALEQREQMYAQALASELSPLDLRTWIAELKALSVAEGVAKIRAVLGAQDPANADSSEIGSPS